MKSKIGPSTIIGMLAILVWCLLPVVWIIMLSFKPEAETTAGSPQFLPKSWTFANY
jgi:multiple sugar transport system permease protein